MLGQAQSVQTETVADTRDAGVQSTADHLTCLLPGGKQKLWLSRLSSVPLTGLPLIVQLNDPVHCPHICIAPLLGLSNLFRVAASVCIMEAQADSSVIRHCCFSVEANSLCLTCPEQIDVQHLGQ